MNKKKLLIMFLASIMLLAGCSGGKKNGDVVASVDGVDISQEKYNIYYRIQREQLVSQLGEETMNTKDNNGITYGEHLRSNLLDNLISNQVMLNEANKADLGIDIDKLVDDQIKAEKEYATEEQFKKSLEMFNITEDQYRELVRDGILVQEYMDKQIKTYEVNDDEIQKYFDENKDQMDQVSARHILVETEDEAKKVKERLENGEDFSELAKELSKDPGSAANGGELGFFGRGRMFQPFEDYCFSANIGQISDPVKTDAGYHIIQVTDKKDSVDDFKENIKSAIQNEKFVDDMSKKKDKAKINKYMDITKEPEAIQNELDAKKSEAEVKDSTETKDTEEKDKSDTKENKEKTEQKN